MRLLRVQIENRPAIEVIRLYDNERTLFYCAPPTRRAPGAMSKAYRYEMSDEEHRELAALLNSSQGRVAVSGYRCDLMDKLRVLGTRFGHPEVCDN